MCLNGYFPVGGPEIFVAHEQLQKIDFSEGKCFFEGAEIQGIIYLTIVPNIDMKWPFLQTRFEVCKKDQLFLPSHFFIQKQTPFYQGKSMSVLCQTCMKSKKFKICYHSDEERALTDCYTIPEIGRVFKKSKRI